MIPSPWCAGTSPTAATNIFDAAYDHGISSYFMGVRQVRRLEIEEWADIL